MQTRGRHAFKNIVDLFGAPDSVVSDIRKLPAQPPRPAVGWIPDSFSGTAPTDTFGVKTLVHEDIASATMEYPDKTVTMTAWEPTEWCSEWAIDIYVLNG